MILHILQLQKNNKLNLKHKIS